MNRGMLSLNKSIRIVRWIQIYSREKYLWARVFDYFFIQIWVKISNEKYIWFRSLPTYVFGENWKIFGGSTALKKNGKDLFFPNLCSSYNWICVKMPEWVNNMNQKMNSISILNYIHRFVNFMWIGPNGLCSTTKRLQMYCFVFYWISISIFFFSLFPFFFFLRVSFSLQKQLKVTTEYFDRFNRSCRWVSVIARTSNSLESRDRN